MLNDFGKQLRRLGRGTAAAAALCAGSASSHGLIVDDFSVGDFSLTADRFSSDDRLIQTGLASPHVLGGVRDLDLNSQSPGVVEARVSGGSLFLEVSPSPGSNVNGYLDLIYGTESLPLNLDLAGPETALFITVVSERWASDLSFSRRPLFVSGGTFQDGYTSWDRLHQSSIGFNLPRDSPYDLVVPFDSLSQIDPMNVEALWFDFFRINGPSIHEFAAIQVLPIEGLAGDMDRSGSTDLADIAAFVAALQNPQQYTRDHDLSPIYHGDLNGDGFFSLADLQPFADLLGVPASSIAVPEPSAGVLIMFALGWVGRRRRGA